MEYQVNFGFHAFSVPSAVVDNLIKAAKENHLKVLLYLLRYPDRQITPGQAAAFLRISEEQAKEAFSFWMQFNILEDKTEEKQLELFPAEPVLLPAADMPFPVPAPEQSPAPEPPKPKQKKADSTDLFHFLSHESIREMIAASPELEKLLRTAEEKYYRRPLNTVQMDSIVWMYSYLELPAEVIQILFQYCLDTREMINTKYLNSIAESWWQNGIVTPEAAREKVSRLMEFYTFQNYILRLFQLPQAVVPSESQIEMIKKWQYWNFSEELLRYARNCAVDRTHDVNFKYIDKVLQGWKDKNITTLEEAKEERRRHEEEEAKKRKGKKKKHADESDEEKQKRKEKINKYLDLVN